MYMLRAKSNSTVRPRGVIGLQWDAVRIVSGTEAEELEIHKLLDQHRVVGEWFDVECLLDLNFIALFGARKHEPIEVPIVTTSGWTPGKSNPPVKVFTPLCGSGVETSGSGLQ
jgi:hypothetical protein